MLLTPAEAQAHLRVPAGQEDALIALYLGAAEQAALDYLGRPVFATKAEMDATADPGKNAMVVNFAIKAAILLTLGHLYANREDVVGGQVYQIPMGSRDLLRPHRISQGI